MPVRFVVWMRDHMEYPIYFNYSPSAEEVFRILPSLEFGKSEVIRVEEIRDDEAPRNISAEAAQHWFHSFNWESRDPDEPLPTLIQVYFPELESVLAGIAEHQHDEEIYRRQHATAGRTIGG